MQRKCVGLRGGQRLRAGDQKVHSKGSVGWNGLEQDFQPCLWGGMTLIDAFIVDFFCFLFVFILNIVYLIDIRLIYFHR